MQQSITAAVFLFPFLFRLENRVVRQPGPGAWFQPRCPAGPPVPVQKAPVREGVSEGMGPGLAVERWLQIEGVVSTRSLLFCPQQMGSCLEARGAPVDAGVRGGGCFTRAPHLEIYPGGPGDLFARSLAHSLIHSFTHSFIHHSQVPTLCQDQPHFLQ